MGWQNTKYLEVESLVAWRMNKNRGIPNASNPGLLSHVLPYVRVMVCPIQHVHTTLIYIIWRIIIWINLFRDEFIFLRICKKKLKYFLFIFKFASTVSFATISVEIYERMRYLNKEFKTLTYCIPIMGRIFNFKTINTVIEWKKYTKILGKVKLSM